ncbi:hypothetical protein [Halobaculum sp. D14]|uniref:hypothetical protein n=1 Tax=Halobaculum sp. D14 TaxID=3421642 RepID=UPI003EC037FC
MRYDTFTHNSPNAVSSRSTESADDLTEKGRRILSGLYQTAVEDASIIGAQAPTGLGKTGTAIRTLANAGEDVTGCEPVVVALPTTDARDGKTAFAEQFGIDTLVLEGRHDACAASDGLHDEELPNMKSLPVSDWIAEQAEKGLTIREIHTRLKEKLGREPPCRQDGECPALKQWGEFHQEEFDVALCTHEMLHAKMLRDSTNLVIDEMPHYTMGLSGSGPSRQHIREALTLRLQKADAPLESWTELRDKLRHNPDSQLLEETRDAILSSPQPKTDWYFQQANSHRLDEGMLLAILNGEATACGTMYSGSTTYPQTPEAGTAREVVTVVLDEDYTLQRIWQVPLFEEVRSLVCLDAHPYEQRWAANIGMDVPFLSVLDEQEESRWRHQERGLTVVQVGDARRPLTNGDNLSETKAKALLAEIVEESEGDFCSVVAPQSVEDEISGWLDQMTPRDAKSMHYGEEMGRDDFGNEDWGAVFGHIDPGDEDVMDYVAYHRLDAKPEMKTCDKCGDNSVPSSTCIHCNDDGKVRARGRGFDGADADAAEEILKGVTERHVAQSIGRFARNAGEDNGGATVYAWTSVIPDKLVDVRAEGVETTFGEEQVEMLEVLKSQGDWVSTRELTDEVGCTRKHITESLGQMVDRGLVEREKGRGPNPDRWKWSGSLQTYGEVDLNSLEMGRRKRYFTRTKTISTPEVTLSRQQGSVPSKPKDTEQSQQEPDQAAYFEAERKKREEARKALDGG